MSICRCTWVYLSVSPTYYFTPCLLHLRYIKRTKERKKIKLTESVVNILSRSPPVAAEDVRDHTVDVVKYDNRRSKDRTVKVLVHQGQSIVSPQSQRVLLNYPESVTETNILYHPFLFVKPSGCFVEQHTHLSHIKVDADIIVNWTQKGADWPEEYWSVK